MSIIKTPPPERETAPPELRLGADAKVRLDGGVSYKYVESQLSNNQSPHMINMNADDRGTLTKRWGQRYTFLNSLGAGGCNGAFRTLYKGKKVIAWGTFLYTQVAADQPVQIMSGLANAPGVFFVFNGILYYLNGTDYVQWNGVAATQVTGYIPTLTVSRTPTGGGTPNEQFNLLSAGFKESFSGNGSATAFQLSLANLDATVVTATVNGVAKAETTDFTVNRTTGVVTFTAAPSNGTNNVVITAYKTQAGFANRIKNCRYAIDYGGENDTRMFLSGNPNFPNRVFRCGVGDATYWPENTFQNVGTDFELVTGFAKHFGSLVVFKERSLFLVTYSNAPYQSMWGSAQSTVSFPTFPLNSAVGCDMPGTIQTIDNNIVFGNTQAGPQILLSTAIKDERVVRPIGGNINGAPGRPGLLDLPKVDLVKATSVDAGGKYWICVGNVAYVWDYQLGPFSNSGDMARDEERLPWFYYTNINAACWISVDQTLYYGDRANGRLVEFFENFNDFGAAILGRWRSKLFNFGLPDLLKTIPAVWLTTNTGGYSSITINYLSEKGEVLDSQTISTSSFSWSRFAWDTFSWAVYRFATTIKRKPRVKKVIYFQIECSNEVVNQNLSIVSLAIQYLLIRKAK